jgi:calmodulin
MTTNSEVTENELFLLFCRFDANNDGLVDESEFGAILDSLGSHPTNEVLSLEFAAIDSNADGGVEFEEFKAWWLDEN